ncbi:MAG TPA: prepilin-type N-terminal cleavage/methylation domain-containing protein [Geobacteraceae bacterium]
MLKGRANAGFTLIEMVVVIAIIALLAALVFPRLPMTEDARLRSSARTFSALLRYLGDRGATSGSRYRLHLNMSDNSVTVGVLSASGEEGRSDDAFLNRRFLDTGIVLADVELTRLGKVGEGEVTVDFGPGGLGEFLVIHLKGKGERYDTIFAFPQGGRVKVVSGYEEAVP